MPALTALWLPQRARSLAPRTASREGRQPHGDTYKVRQIFSDSPAFVRFVRFWGLSRHGRTVCYGRQ
jgi:hypothetical protein